MHGFQRNKAIILVSMKAAKTPALIVKNQRASHDYAIEERLTAGLVLEGWEVKSLRQKRAHLKESYALVKSGEVWLIGAHISPLPDCSTQSEAQPTRTRKLLLNRREISRLTGLLERKGYTLVPLKMYWQKNRAKLELGLGRGKHTHDKRADERRREWEREKRRLAKKFTH